MKQLFSLLLSISLAQVSFAQERPATLLNDNRLKYGGFGGVLFDVSTVRGQVLVSVGGAGAASINNQFFFGGFGQSGTTSFELPDKGRYRTTISQGGFWYGYVFRPSRLVHLLTDLRLGWTSLELSNASTSDRIRQYGFTTTPSLGAELNVASFLRIRLTGGYRFASGLGGSQPAVLSNRDISSAVGTLSFQFGRFR
jgi:hypothetical protein